VSPPEREIEALGADVCLVDGPKLAQRAKDAAAGGTIRLAIDALGGNEAKRLGFAVAEGGTVCNYGTLTGPDVVVASSDLIARDVRYVGFWVARSLRRRSQAERVAFYSDMASRVVAGELSFAVEDVYPIGEITAAIEHALRPGRTGKILVAPNESI
jgi:NADPH:quinone reductase-like Zn-dependent oxidoreductase